jgi:ATP-binding cassette subfamily B protein RaxB
MSRIDLPHLWARRSGRIRLLRQTEVAECGLASLAMVAGYYGQQIDLPFMRRQFAPSLRGTTMRALIDLADQLGFVPRAVKLPLESLGSLQMPAILHWDLNHYVVLEAVRADKALIHDPNGISRWLPFETVSNHFTGVALELRPGHDFKAGHHVARLRLNQLWNRISGAKRALGQVVVLSLVLQAFVLASPYYMQIALDSVVPAMDRDLMLVLALGFGLFGVIYAAASLLRSYVLLVAGSALSFSLATNIARRLFRLPVPWFERRHMGDILSRFQSIAPIKQLLTEVAAIGLVDGVLAIATLFVMFFYSASLALIALFAFAAYLAVRMLSFSAEREAQEDLIVTVGKEQTTLIESIRGMTTLRLFGREALRHAVWQSHLVESINANTRLSRIRILQTAANLLIFTLENVITVWLAISYVVSASGFSIGMVFAYLAYKTQFIDKASALVDQAIAFKMLGLHLERLSDIALSDEDDAFHQPGSKAELEGTIELVGVDFRYGPAEPLVLSGLSLKVETGEHVAITGPSGGGKSTLIKLLLSLATPERGWILIDGVPLEQFGAANFRRQIAAVLQDDNLFAGSLADNIALFEERIDLDWLVECARAAAIHDDIMQMPMQYDTLVGDMGSTLSGGQKQRVLLARALYKRPRILVMDEGTAHLDAAHEQAVNAAINRLGITRIIVAHRQETVAAADRIVSLVDGKIPTSSEDAQEA